MSLQEKLDEIKANNSQLARPQPLTSNIEPEAYPESALPEIVRDAVNEVHSFVQCPYALVATSAIAALSVAIQAHCDIERATRLKGPSGLFTLSIADSGERKTTCDGFFTSAIREYEAQQAELAKPKLKEHAAELAAWTSERDGILSAIKRAAGQTDGNTKKLRDDLKELEHNKPEPPRVPSLLLGDETPENLAYRLAKNYPVAGVISSEAGVVFGSHGMGKDSAMRNLGLLNVLWDGGSLSIGRRSTESFTVEGARLTVALQIQEATLREFFDKSGGLARGSGFLARFLVAWPSSTQGTRFFREAPETWPRLSAFNARLTDILNTKAPINERGILEPLTLEFTPDAKAAWIEFHNSVEVQLQTGGELYDVKDVASKIADNAARLSALFHVFDNGIGDAVGVDSFERASQIARWYLQEARRFFGELALPIEMANASRLDAWLIEHCKREKTHLISKRFVLQHGPIRDDARLMTALNELYELDRALLLQDGKKKTIKVNPALLENTKPERVATATVATLATLATLATHSKPTVATVASVAVANSQNENAESLSDSDRRLLLEYLDYLGEDDPASIDELLTECAKDSAVLQNQIAKAEALLYPAY